MNKIYSLSFFVIVLSIANTVSAATFYIYNGSSADFNVIVYADQKEKFRGTITRGAYSSRIDSGRGSQLTINWQPLNDMSQAKMQNIQISGSEKMKVEKVIGINQNGIYMNTLSK